MDNWTPWTELRRAAEIRTAVVDLCGMSLAYARTEMCRNAAAGLIEGKGGIGKPYLIGITSHMSEDLLTKRRDEHAG